ncbi:MAG: PQQ-binding-like beta-propeller repeat protein [Acidobacteriota bacterium]
MTGDFVNRRTLGLLSALILALILPATAAAEPTESWTQWGGPHQDFKAPSQGIADAWPASGPKQLWSRELGDGYSTILVEDGKLYTMYRVGESNDEAIISLDAATGKTLWEHRYDSNLNEGHVKQFGSGPRSTPLLTGDELYAIGISGKFHSLDKATGKVRWAHDLWGDEFGGNFLNHGYSSSPIEYKDTVIATVGGEGKSLVAFNKSDGSVAWQNLSYQNSYSTPQVLEVDGHEQLVVFMAKELIGVDPTNGNELWRYPQENQWDQNINLPALVDGQYLFLSSLQAGARGLKLTVGEDGKTDVEELWSSRKIQFYHATTVHDGEWVYGSSGSRSPAFMSAVNIKTGEIPWRKRGFAKANSIYADGHVIVLDEDGKLYLTTATPENLEVHSEIALLDKVAWSAPTVVGTKLYVRDKASIMALDLSPEANTGAVAMAAEKAAMAKEKVAAAGQKMADAGDKAAEKLAAAMAIQEDDSEAMQILKRSAAALGKVKSVKFKGSAEPHGPVVAFIAASSGKGMMTGWNGRAAEKFFAHVETSRPGSEETMEISGGGNGEVYFLVNHSQKKAYEDLDPAVMGTIGRNALGSIALLEFVQPAPFTDQVAAQVELAGTETVAGVECHRVEVVYGDQRGKETWFIGTEDSLPRRQIRYFDIPQQGEGSLVTTLTDLVVNPELDVAMFKLDLPEGYEQVDDFAP